MNGRTAHTDHTAVFNTIVSHARLQLTVALLLVTICITGCVRRDGRNSDCTWPGEHPAQPSTARHLSRDAEFAEELADRYTNVHFGPRSAYVGPPIAGRERHQCMVRLFQEIAKTHGVSAEQVTSSYGHNRLDVDLAEILSFAIVFGMLALVLVPRVWARYPPGEGLAPAILMIALCSVAFGIVAVLIGPLWSMAAENFRIGTGHLGPRVLRLPMERYPKLVFIASVVLFWAIAVIRRPRLIRRVPQELSS